MASEPPGRRTVTDPSDENGDGRGRSRKIALALLLLLLVVLVSRGLGAPEALLRLPSLLLGAGALTAIGGLLMRREHHRWIATAVAGLLVMIWVLWTALAGP